MSRVLCTKVVLAPLHIISMAQSTTRSPTGRILRSTRDAANSADGPEVLAIVSSDAPAPRRSTRIKTSGAPGGNGEDLNNPSTIASRPPKLIQTPTQNKNLSSLTKKRKVHEEDQEELKTKPKAKKRAAKSNPPIEYEIHDVKRKETTFHGVSQRFSSFV